MTAAEARAWLAETPFMGPEQKAALRAALAGEEAEGIAAMLAGVRAQIDACPVTFSESKVAALHYFGGCYDAWITEKDIEGGVEQAFGYCSFAGKGGGEFGYVSIEEIVAAGIELDLYWRPKPIGEFA